MILVIREKTGITFLDTSQVLFDFWKTLICYSWTLCCGVPGLGTDLASGLLINVANPSTDPASSSSWMVSMVSMSLWTTTTAILLSILFIQLLKVDGLDICYLLDEWFKIEDPL